MYKQLYIYKQWQTQIAKQITRDKVLRDYLIHFCLTGSYCFIVKSSCSNESSQKRREDDTSEARGLPDRGVKGNFRDCFSHFLRYRLDIWIFRVTIEATHTYISRSRGYNRTKSRMWTDAVPLFAPLSARTDDGASTERGESGKISRPRDQTEWTARFSSPVTSISGVAGEKDRWLD